MRLTQEGRYRLTKAEHIRGLFLWSFTFSVIGWLFYDCLWLGIIGIPTYGLFYKINYQYKLDKCQKQLRFDFKDMMLSVYSSLSAGATLETSIRRALSDLERSLTRESRIVQELELVCQKMDRNISVNQCLEDMAKRCGDRDMNRFFRVLSLGKRQGGNMAQLVRDSVEKIQRRIEISYEINGIVGANRSEFAIMCAIPLVIIIYMRIFSAEFMEVLYTSMAGMFCMTGCLGLYALAVWLGLRILKLDK